MHADIVWNGDYTSGYEDDISDYKKIESVISNNHIAELYLEVTFIKLIIL